MSGRISTWWQRWQITADEVTTLVRRAIQPPQACPSAGKPPRLSGLEPRILFSATPIDPSMMPGGQEAVMIAEIDDPASDPEATTIDTLAQTDAREQSSQIVIIDSSVPDLEKLLDDLARSGRVDDVFVLDAERDGLDQITEILDGRSEIDSIHLVSHAEDGAVKLGSTWLSQQNVSAYAGQLAAWQSSLSADADLLLYGCDLAAEQTGQALIESLSVLTGADVAASTDDTGHSDFGANWTLEYVTGTVDSQVAFSDELQQAWHRKLSTITVTTLADELSSNGLTSLREAILASNAGGGGDTILLGSGVHKLIIGGSGEDVNLEGDLDILQSVTIQGLADGSSVIDGNGIDRVFHVIGGTLTMMDVTVEGGNVNDVGGGILVDSGADGLTLERVIVQDNFATSGAGIYNNEVTTLTDVVLENNGDKTTTAEGGGFFNKGTSVFNRVSLIGNEADTGGGIHNDNSSGSDVTLTNVTVSGNTAASSGGGLYNEETATIVNSTFAFNQADDTGGVRVKSGTLTIRNSIISDNVGTSANNDVEGTFTSQGNNLIADATGGSGFVGSDFLGTSADLESLSDYGGFIQTHALAANSLAIDNGLNVGAPAEDGRGFARRDGIVDIGAYESNSVAIEKVYWSDLGSNKIQRSNLDGSNVEDVVTGIAGADGIALFVDTTAGKLYWSEQSNGKILRADLDGTNSEDVLTALNQPREIVVDASNGKIYWTEDGFGVDKIRRANLDGTGIEDLITTGLDSPGGISLDVVAGKLYWVDTGNGKVQRANLDGTGVEDLVTGLNGPRRIKLDLSAGKIYWTDDGTLTNVISRANLDGTSVETLIASGLSGPTGIELDLQAGKLYWTDYAAQTVRMSDLDGSNVVDVVASGLTTPVGLALGGVSPPTPLTGLAVTARETIDLDEDGHIDHIRFTTAENLNDDFSGLTITVAGYSLDATTPYLTNLSAGGDNDTVFYVKLQEGVTHDTGATPVVTITANSTLGEQGGGSEIDVDSGVASTDAASPVLISATSNQVAGATIFQSVGDRLDLVFSESLNSLPTPADLETALTFAAGATDGDNLPGIGTGANPLSLVTVNQANDTIRILLNTDNVVGANALTVGTHNVRVSGASYIQDLSGVSASTITAVTITSESNSAPTLSGGPFQFTTTDEDTNTIGVTVATILAGLTTSDADGDTLGMAVTTATGNGTWQYSVNSTNGVTGNWTDFGTVASNDALILADDYWIRYEPDAENGEAVSIVFHAWDGTSGSASFLNAPSTADPGSSSAFSNGTAQANLTVTDLNDAPTGNNLSSTSSYNEGDTSVAITDIMITDVDNNENVTATLTLADTGTGSLSNNDGATYDAGTGVWTVDGTLASVNLALQNLVFNPIVTNHVDTTISVVMDDGNEDASAPLTGTITLDVTSVNTPATVTLTQVVNAMSENTDTSSSIKIADVNLSDDGEGTNTFRLTGSDAGLFELQAGNTELHLRDGVTLDFETNPTLAVSVEVDDPAISGDPDSSESLSVTINDTNDAPTDITLDNTVVNENADGATIGNLAVDDQDPIDVHTWSVSDSRFQIVGSQLMLKAGESLDHESEPIVNLSITVTDQAGTGESFDKSFLITVNDIDEAPVTVSDAYSVISGSSLNVAASGVLQNDFDPESGSLTAVLLTGPSHGTLTLNSNGSFVYTPNVGFSGTDVFTYEASDGVFASTPTVVTITATPVFVLPPPPPPPPPPADPAPPDNPDPVDESSEEDSSDRETPSDSGNAPPPIATVTASGSTTSPSPASPIGEASFQPDSARSNFAAPTIGVPEQSNETADNQRAEAGANSAGNTMELESTERVMRLGIDHLLTSPTHANYALMATPGTMWNELDEQLSNVDSQIQGDLIVVGTAGAAASGFTVGVVGWALRTGFLASGLLAQLPAWRAVDPMLIMQGLGANDAGKETLEELMKRQSDALES